MKKVLNTKNMALCGMFTALIAIGAFIKIPFPTGVPFSLQFMFTMLAGFLLGNKLGSLSVLIYLFIGLAGIPIFTSGGGIGYVLKPTFGYMIGFVLSTFTIGTISRSETNPSYLRLVIANFAGTTMVYVCGTVYFYFIMKYVSGTVIGFKALITSCVLMTIWSDIFFCFFTAFIAKKLIPKLRDKIAA